MRLICNVFLSMAVVAVTLLALVAQLGAEDQVKSKRRRIILNDDSTPVFVEKSLEAFVAKRLQQAKGTQVDTYIIYVGDGWHPRRGRKPHPSLGDPYQVMVDEAHKAGMEIFASLRMNDIHCARDGTASPLKREKPHLLIGEQFGFQRFPGLMEGEQPSGGGYPEGSLFSYFWPGYDYAEPEVREFRLKRIEYICRKYDYDGFELDFFRHPLFFKPGEERENIGVMTDFVRQIRRKLNEIGTERGRPYLLAVRVPDTPQMALRTGLDVQTWVKEGLVDMLMVAGGYNPWSAHIKEFIDMAHRHGIPAYPTVDIGGYYSPGVSLLDSYCQPDAMRSIASNFWALGADGVYLFNWYGLPKQATEQLALLNQLGDVEKLRNVNKRFEPDPGRYLSWCGYSNLPDLYPVRIIDGAPVELVVGDDVQKAAEEGKLDALELRIKVAQMQMSEGINVIANGVSVPSSKIQRTGEREFRVDLSTPPLRQGINEIVVLPGKGSFGRVNSVVTQMYLSVRYK